MDYGACPCPIASTPGTGLRWTVSPYKPQPANFNPSAMSIRQGDAVTPRSPDEWNPVGGRAEGGLRRLHGARWWSGKALIPLGDAPCQPSGGEHSQQRLDDGPRQTRHGRVADAALDQVGHDPRALLDVDEERA